jgi:hypothetical protein
MIFYSIFKISFTTNVFIYNLVLRLIKLHFKVQIHNHTHNSTYKKLAVQWLNEALCFVSSSVLKDCFVFQNRQLLVAAKRYVQV